MYSYGPSHMAEQKQDNQLKHTYSSSVRIRCVALKTCLRWWTIRRSGERGSGISVLAAWHDNDDDDGDLLSRFLRGEFLNNVKDSSPPYHLYTTGRRIVRFMSFQKVLVLWEMWATSSRATVLITVQLPLYHDHNQARLYIYIYIYIYRCITTLLYSYTRKTLQTRIETPHLTLHQIDYLSHGKLVTQRQIWNLIHMYKLSFIFILCYCIPKCPIR